MKIDRHNDFSSRIRTRAGRILLVIACGIGGLGLGIRPAESEDPPASTASDAEEEHEAEVTNGDDQPLQDRSPNLSVPPSLRFPQRSLDTDDENAQPAASENELAEDDRAAPIDQATESKARVGDSPSESLRAERAADLLIRDTMRRLTAGPAFDAKLTQHIWAHGREVVGVGRYEQAGEETGWFSMEMMIPTASGKCLLQQMSDGRLAWTREQVGERVRLRRVDVGRLDELVPSQSGGGFRPGLRVGGLVELLQRIHTDYRLVRTAGKVDGRPVWVLRGTLREHVAESIAPSSGGAWPGLCPREVLVAIAADRNEQGFGKGLPARIEFWSDRPDGVNGESDSVQLAQRNLISLLKIYDARRINPAPQQHFSFETGESDVQFINDTERYVEMFGVKLTAKERVMLLR